MKKKLSAFWTITKRTFKGWNEDDPFRQSAAIAYYAVFSLPALSILIINVVGFFFGKEEVSEELTRQAGNAMGEDTGDLVKSVLAKTSETKAGVISSIIAIVTIIFGATGVFMQLQKSLNRTWDVKEKEKQGVMYQIRHRLFSFGLIVSIGFLMLVSLVISTALAAFSHWLKAHFPDFVANLFFVIDVAISIGVVTVLFALMFKILPDVKQRWKQIWPGALVTAVLFTIGKYALSLYFGKAEPESVYGAAGSIIILLLWVSYSSMIVFFGAEFTKQYQSYHGIKPEPTNAASKIILSDVTLSDDGKIKANGNGKVSKEVKELVGEIENRGNGHKGNGSLKKNGEISNEKSAVQKELEIINEDIRYREKTPNPQNTEVLDKYRPRKLKSRKDLVFEIHSMEKRINEDVVDIEENLKGPLLGGTLARWLGIEADVDRRVILDEYLRQTATNRFKRKPENWTDKVARLAEFLKTEFS